MGFLKASAEGARDALEGFSDPALDDIREQARHAATASRKTFAVRLPLPEGQGVGDVRFWSAAVQQIEMHGWELQHWNVCAEPSGTVAYGFFTR